MIDLPIHLTRTHGVCAETTSNQRLPDAAASLAAQFVRTRQAPGDIAHFDFNNNFRGTTPRRAAVVSRMDLRSELPAADPARLIGGLPTGTEAGKVTTFDAALFASSAVLQAGVRLILWEDTAAPVAPSGGGVLAFESKDVRFDLLRPAAWHHVPDGDDVPSTPPAIASHLVDMELGRSLGVRVELSRAEQHRFASDGRMAAEVLTSFALGLGRALDQQFLESLLLSEPQEFALAKLASGGFHAQEARAIVGRNATGAACEPAGGHLHVGGIPAQFSDTTDETLVLVGNCHAVAVDTEIRVLCERTSVDGSLALTAWAAVLPIYGDLSAAWKVAA